MACIQDNTLLDYVEGRLEQWQVARVVAHADDCSRCQRQLAQVAATFLRGSGFPLVEGGAGEITPYAFLRPGPTSARRIGARIDRFKVTSLLGAGGMGIVYAARDPDRDYPVALKLIRSRGQHSAASLRQRLIREAEAMARLSHPNVASVYEVGLVDDQVFIVMELVEGSTLRQWAKAKRRHWRTIVDAYRQAGRALAAGHALGIVHRDFKPDNALIDDEGRVRVVDFGLAQLGDGGPLASGLGEHPVAGAAKEVSTRLTRTGALVGTPAYMAPEQFHGQPVEPAADQFSFCVSLYEALWNQRPFAGVTVDRLAQSITTGEIREPPPVGHVPASLYRVLAKGLGAAPRARHSSMETLLAALDPSRQEYAHMEAGRS
jgi:serine/threonine protein kinase